MKTFREIVSPNSIILKERKSIVGALNPQNTDIYKQKAMTPHQTMEEMNTAYDRNRIVSSAIDTCADFIFGGDIVFRSDDKETEIRGQAFVKQIKLNEWGLIQIRETIKTGNGWVEMDFNPVTGLPQKFYPQSDSSRWYINCDDHGEAVKTKKIIPLENGGYETQEVENLDEFYIQRLAPGIKYKYAKWWNLSYFVDQKYRQFRIYGIPVHKHKMLHARTNLDLTGIYGQSYLASALNDMLILHELERSISVLAKYKAVPRKIISYGDKDNPATGEELDDLVIYLESLERDEDPIVNKPIKMDDLSYAGGEINLDYMLTHIRKKLTSGVVPDFLTGFGNDVNRATAQVELISYILSIYTKRRHFLSLWEEKIIKPWLTYNNLENGWLEFNELDFETKQEKTNRTMAMWSANTITLNEFLEENGKTKKGEEGDVYYTEWQNKLMERSQPQLPNMQSTPLNYDGMDFQQEEQPLDQQVMPEKYSVLNESNLDPAKDSTGLTNLVQQTALGIRKYYKKPFEIAKNLAVKKASERFKEDLTKKDIRELATLIKIGSEDIKTQFNDSIKQAYIKGIQDGGKQIGIISGVPFSTQNYTNLQKQSWRYVKKNIDEGVSKVESVLLEGILGKKEGAEFEKMISQTYNFLSWKSESLAENELRKAYTSAIKHTMNYSPYKKFKWNTHEDEKVCNSCAPLDGKVFTIENLNAPNSPLHVNCRCNLEILKE